MLSTWLLRTEDGDAVVIADARQIAELIATVQLEDRVALATRLWPRYEWSRGTYPFKER